MRYIDAILCAFGYYVLGVDMFTTLLIILATLWVDYSNGEYDKKPQYYYPEAD